MFSESILIRFSFPCLGSRIFWKLRLCLWSGEISRAFNGEYENHGISPTKYCRPTWFTFRCFWVWNPKCIPSPNIRKNIVSTARWGFFPVLWDDFHPTRKFCTSQHPNHPKMPPVFRCNAEVRLLPCANTPQADLQLSCGGLSLRFLFGQPSCWSSEFGKGWNSNLINRSVKRSKLKRKLSLDSNYLFALPAGLSPGVKSSSRF